MEERDDEDETRLCWLVGVELEGLRLRSDLGEAKAGTEGGRPSLEHSNRGSKATLVRRGLGEMERFPRELGACKLVWQRGRQRRRWRGIV